MDETVLDAVIGATGLPKDHVKKRLENWIVSTGRSPQALTLEDLREVLVHFLQDLFCEVKAGQNEFVKISD